MADDYAKVNSMIDGEEEAQPKLPNKQSLASKLFQKGTEKAAGAVSGIAGAATSAGTKFAAGTVAAVQSTSLTSIISLIGIILGINIFAGPSEIPIKDDYDPNVDYECLDEYAEAYKGIFGTISETPLAEQTSTIVKRLKEINEWSKTYMGQSVPDKLVCTVEDCPFYGHEGCTDPNHTVEKWEGGTYTYIDSGRQIDLANVKRIHSFFSAYGLTDVQIAAICGVMTIESTLDFTSLEGYNFSGDYYGLDPSTEGSFKAWEEGLDDSPINPASCIHLLGENYHEGMFEDEPNVDYSEYSAEYPAIYKIGIGLIGFTDGADFYNNTFLRNYADFLNDKVNLIQNIVEGSRGWREELRQRAADIYSAAFGAEDDDKRGTATKYYEFIDPDNNFLFGDTSVLEAWGERYDEETGKYKSSAWIYKEAREAYEKAEKELVEAIEDYDEAKDKYMSAYKALTEQSWQYHSVSSSDDPNGAPLQEIVFEKHDLTKDAGKVVTNFQENVDEKQYLTICNGIETLVKVAEDSTWQEENFIEYEDTTNPGNNIDIVYPKVEPIWQQIDEDPAQTQNVSITCLHGSENAPIAPTPVFPPGPQPQIQQFIMGFNPWTGQPMYDVSGFTNAMQQWSMQNGQYQMYLQRYQQYQQQLADFNASQAAAGAEHAQIMSLYAQLQAAEQGLQEKYDIMMQKKAAYDETLEDLNKWSKIFAHDIMRFYNAVQDYYTASQFDMEAEIRDGTLTPTTIFDDASFYTKAAYEYKFNAIIDGEEVVFRDVFDELGTETKAISDDDYKPTTQQLRLYYELWQNYAKYATELPRSGKYINWWTPEVQLLYMVGGAYDAENEKGIKVKDEYREGGDCSKCGQNIPENDTTAEYYYNWMSTWKGDNYTGRDLTTATKNFYLDMVSGGFDDGTLQERTEYAYAYYYMFQYDSPYQQAINYASVGGEASKIMDEMIAEGRWQTDTSNTLSNRAMPHNDKWNDYQENYQEDTRRVWEIDTSTNLSNSILSTLGEKQSHSQVNLLTDIYNGCKYINVIDNETIGNAAMYLVDNPLIYESTDNKFYKLKYGDTEQEPVSDFAKTVYTIINKRLQDNGKTAMSGDITGENGFNFVKTCVLWSGLDIEFENLENVDDLKEYLEEATSSIWQEDPTEDYQTDEDDEKAIGRGNSKIWEQRKLGPYYDENGEVFYRYKWFLVPRVLADSEESDTDLLWYDDLRNDDAERGYGDVDEDLDNWEEHEVDEHDTNNQPTKAHDETTDKEGYKRKANEDTNRVADWIRVDWECWDTDCEECKGKGGHGNTDLLVAGDIMINDEDGQVCIWLGEDAVGNMFPLEKDSEASDEDDSGSAGSDDDAPLVYAGGTDATKIKAMDGDGTFEWSKPCDSYINHETPCPEHGALSTLPTEPVSSQDEEYETCDMYDPTDKWTVYRLITPNYTDSYRSAGITSDYYTGGDEWETWYEYRYKSAERNADTKLYLEEIRKELGLDKINTDYDRDRRLYG